MSRNTLVVPEDQKVIEKMRRKYNKAQMTPDAAMKVHHLEMTNKALKTATTVAGVVTAIDWIVPDPSPLVDEVVLTGLTTLLKTANVIVDRKIQDIVEKGDTEISMDEVSSLTSCFQNMVSSYQEAKTR